MFYLKIFFQFVLKYPGRGGLYIFFTTLLILSTLFWPNIRDKFWNYYAENPIYPYFYAILGGNQDIEGIRAKLISMPGVVNVELKTKEEIQEKIKHNFQDMGIPQDMMEISASAFKVYMDVKLDPKGLDLIREYLKRSIQNEDIMMTELEQDIVAQKMYKNNIIPHLKKWGEISIVIVMTSIWLLCFSLFLIPLRKMSYLIETYQRKKKVAFKIIIISLLLFLLVVSIPVSFFILPSVPGLVVFLSFVGFVSWYPCRGNYEYAAKT